MPLAVVNRLETRDVPTRHQHPRMKTYVMLRQFSPAVNQILYRLRNLPVRASPTCDVAHASRDPPDRTTF